MTVLEAIKTKMNVPKEFHNGSVYGPISYDDPFEIIFWYKETKSGPAIRKIIKIKQFEIVDE